MNRRGFLSTHAVAITIASGLFLAAPVAHAGIQVSNLFTDNMVLQREVPIPVFGTGDTDGEIVTVAFGRQKISTRVADGVWKVHLTPMSASSGPQTLFVSSSIENGKSKIENLLIGDVWLAGGQSNMDYDIAKFLAMDKHPEVKAQYQQFVDEGGNVPNLRMVLLEKTTDGTPLKTMPSIDGWQAGSPERVPAMTATGYVFARKLHEYLEIPIGLIDCNKGGSRAEVWMAGGRKSYHNGMLAPMMQLPIKGVIWYQGESNAKTVANAIAYKETLQAMIGDWRKGWGTDFPFIIVQLAAYDKKPGNNVCYPLLREAQMNATALPTVGIVTAIDIGEKLDIHTCFKIPLSERLVDEARAIAYGETLVHRGPVFQSLEIAGNRAVVSFDHIGSGLEFKGVQLDTFTVSGDRLQGFEICGADGVFVPANAVIDGSRVIITHPDIGKPVHVRYAWAGFPLCNLYNKEGLPAFPFRTDDFVPVEPVVESGEAAPKPSNVLFIISDDLTSTALGCYGNTVCKTPNIDRLAAQGTQFTRAYCQATFCGPSRASFMFGYYPYASKATGYTSGREKVGPDKDSWPQYFRRNGYHAARISKVFHMAVPGDIGKGSDGADDPASWDEAFNSKGPESKASGLGEILENNPGGVKKGAGGGNHFAVVEADGDDWVHSDGKTAQKAAELIATYKHLDKPFFLAVGFVRPHVPFVAPKKYFAPYVAEDMVLPPKIPGDQDDIPMNAANRRTSANYKMDIGQQKRLIRGYYASVSYMDAMVGTVVTALDESGQRDNTIIIFTSDHGYHLGEHDMWSKVSIHTESAQVPLIICVPGQNPAVCRSFVELLDLYPTMSGLCGLEIPGNLQGKDISGLLVDPTAKVRDAVLSSGKGLLLRDDRWAYLHYGKDAELYDMHNDPKQYTNLASNPEYAQVLAMMRKKLDAKLAEVRVNDLGKGGK